MITAEQLRAARGLLNWGRAECAKAAHVSPETIKNIECDAFTPQQATIDNLVQAFGSHGVEFFGLPSVNIAGVLFVGPRTQKPEERAQS